MQSCGERRGEGGAGCGARGGVCFAASLPASYGRRTWVSLRLDTLVFVLVDVCFYAWYFLRPVCVRWERRDVGKGGGGGVSGTGQICNASMFGNRTILCVVDRRLTIVCGRLGG